MEAFRIVPVVDCPDDEIDHAEDHFSEEEIVVDHGAKPYRKGEGPPALIDHELLHADQQ